MELNLEINFGINFRNYIGFTFSKMQNLIGSKLTLRLGLMNKKGAACDGAGVKKLEKSSFVKTPA